MKAVFENITNLDKALVSKYNLSEDLMMEHAANSLNFWVRKHLKKGKAVQILCGSGNNGADGIACARMLFKDYKVSIFLLNDAKSDMAKLQLTRAKKLQIPIDKKIKNAKLYIDALFGSGLNRELSQEIKQILHQVNKKNGLKLACDIPSGIMQNGNVLNIAFKAHSTICMGALKSSLFSDKAKEYIGNLHVKNLGVTRSIYEEKSDTFVLEKKDLSLPLRKTANTNKGTFGHLSVIMGDKKGACLLTAKAGFYFGAGLVSLITEDKNIPTFLMQSKTLPINTTAIACGMGLGTIKKDLKDLLTKTKLPLVIDADILVSKYIKKLLHVKKNIVLTPHLKEFSIMCKMLDFANYNIEQIQANKLQIARDFSLKYPQILVLKGANTIIANNGICYISPFGTQALSKGGSGDVLAGLIASLLAQGKSLQDASINGVLAHGLSAKKFTKNSYSLSPNDIIKGIKCL